MIEESDSPAALYAFVIGIFLVGLLAGGGAIRLGLNSGMRRIFAVALTVEALCLGLLILIGSSYLATDTVNRSGLGTYAGVALSAFAMGVQNTVVRMTGPLNVYTTHVTGTISRLGEDTVNYLAARLARRRTTGPDASEETPSAGPLLLSSAMWIVYVGAAILGAYLFLQIGWIALVYPVGATLVIVVIDLVTPFHSSPDG